MAGEEPGFGNAPSYLSDIQFSHAVSPDKKAISILFDNFELRMGPGAAPVATRTFTFVMPLKGATSGATITGGVQGGGAMEKGTGATLIFRAAGMSRVFDPVFASADENSFTKPIHLNLPPGGDLRMSIVIALEGNPADAKSEAILTVSAVDLTIGPPEASSEE